MRKRLLGILLAIVMVGSTLGMGFGGVIALILPGGPVVTRSATNEALAILNSDFKDYLVGATFTGVNEQILIATKPVLGFPLNGDSYLILSSGDARYVLNGSEEYDVGNVGGIFIPNGQPVTGQDAYDVATLRITLKVPDGATTLSFSWRMVSDDYPPYNDFFYSYVEFPDGKKVVAATLPNGTIPYISSMWPVFVEVNGKDGVPMWHMGPIYTATVDVSKYQGKTITLVLQVGDAGDAWVDTAVLVDNLRFTITPSPTRGQEYLQLLTVAKLWTLRFFTFHDRFDELYTNATTIGVDNETLSKAMELHNNATATMQAAWGNYNLSTVRRLMWSTMFMPKIGLIIKAYKDEMAAIKLLEDAIAEAGS
ncbi:choice-of-anchor L domain-containing protein [Thermococcus sp.]